MQHNMKEWTTTNEVKHLDFKVTSSLFAAVFHFPNFTVINKLIIIFLILILPLFFLSHSDISLVEVGGTLTGN